MNRNQIFSSLGLSMLIILGVAHTPAGAQSYIGVPSGFTGAGPWMTSVVATTDMGAGSGTNIQHVVDGSGLDSPSLTALHKVSTPANAWVSAFGTLTGEVTISLGQQYLVDTFSLWNFSDGPGAVRGASGIQDVTVEYSTDGINYSVLPGGPTQFAQVSSTSTSNPPQIFDFAPVTASYFQFEIASNYGNPNDTGFDEVGFGSVPEPGSAATLVGLVSPGAVLLIRRRMAARGAR